MEINYIKKSLNQKLTRQKLLDEKYQSLLWIKARLKFLNMMALMTEVLMGGIFT